MPEATVEELNRILADLRTAGTDHRSVEAKSARTDLPSTLTDTLSSFANTDGGLILLGVTEGTGDFKVTGVEDPKRVCASLQAAAERMEPPLRPAIDVVPHPDGTVVMASLGPIPREQRPCHRGDDGPYTSSFIRVGDADQHLTATEVGVMIANRSQVDTGRTPAPQGARLNPEAVAAFVSNVRGVSDRVDGVADEELLFRYGALDGDDRSQVTLAGFLTLGEHPQGYLDCARVSVRREPTEGDPPGTRHDAVKIEGTIGELFDDVMTALSANLGHAQVEREGQLYEELDVPTEALREVVSNALVHRSFVNGARNESVLVEVNEEAVVITSPGGIHVSADPRTLGLDPISGVRNQTLVRICEHLRTPSGARVIEHQALGISRADRACHTNGTMPALFVDLPTRFSVVLLRRSLNLEPAREILRKAGHEDTPEAVRLVAMLSRLEEARASASSELGPVLFDARLCARALAPCSVEDAASEIRSLEEAGILRRVHVERRPAWVFATGARKPELEPAGPAEPGAHPAALTEKADRVNDLVMALAAAKDGQMSATEIQHALGLESTNSRYRWIKRATDKNLIDSTSDRPFDRTNKFFLTATGKALARRLTAGIGPAQTAG